ncbi:centrosomal protein of 295 kDa isoform X3 [Nerophis ophidion]|uniref:centrosomal protein of 295 kDa isoform X3 n=1 Tax=Nerophis ophidion TaxID=159077 RepID=UPI002ADF7666|nr:centrosomal protein of 295 kDa isoform X3 [Nerophis ophidion]
MKRMVAKFRPSPNEEAQKIREEMERRRKLRLQQVREQQKSIALQMRQNVEQRRHRELEQLEEDLRDEWERERSERLSALQILYEHSLQMVGQGQRMAKENEPDLVAIAQKEAENHAKAEERFRGALEELKSQKLKDSEMQNRIIKARKKALQVEKARSEKAARLPAPPPNPLLVIDIVPEKPHLVKKCDVNAYAFTHYHMPATAVDREEDIPQTSAHQGAELAMKNLEDLQRDNEKKRVEQHEKARLRGKSALRKEHLALDRDRLLEELELKHRADMLRRRQQVIQMPPQIFHPLCKKQEMKDDFQKEMEFAFKDMYTGESRVKGNMLVQLIPEPLPEASTSCQDNELDVTLEGPATSELQADRKQESQRTYSEDSAYMEPRHPPRQNLKRLLNRIRCQRNQPTIIVHSQVAERDTDVESEMIPEQDTITIPQEVPERDTIITQSGVVSERTTTIETGSLSNQPVLAEPTKAPSSSSSSLAEAPIPANMQNPDQLYTKTMEFEEEQKKREMELERETQQQLALLKELDDQKAQLEQLLLLRGQREEVHLNQNSVSVQELEETHSPEQRLPVDEDEHARRIQQYQDRLLEQNRNHHKSVEEARQRLEDYQHALQIRHNMAAVSLPSAVEAAGHLHPPAPSALSAGSVVSAHLRDDLQTDVQGPSRQPAGPALPLSPPGPSSSFLPRELAPSSNQSSNQMLSCSIAPPKPVTRDIIPPKPVTKEILSPQVVPTKSLPPKQVSKKTLPQVVTKELLPRVISTESLTSTHTASPSFRQASGPIQPDTMSRPLLTSSSTASSPAADENSSRLPSLEVQSLDEQRQRQEENMALVRQQKETLQALINVDSQPLSDVLPSEDAGQTRGKLLSSLLKVIEKSNAGSSPPEDQEGPHRQAPSTSKTGNGTSLPPARAAKPPVTRVRLGTTMQEQHELSAIQEVETPVDTSLVTGMEDVFSAPQHTIDWSLQEQFDSSVASDHRLRTPTTSSSSQQSAERLTSAGTNSARSSLLLHRQRLLMETPTPDSSEHDSGTGEDFLGPALTTHNSPADDSRSPGEASRLSSHGPPDRFSATTMSTGSYISSDPESNAGKSPTLNSTEPQLGAHILGTSSLLTPNSTMRDSTAAGPSHTAQLSSLFNEDNVQCIIDRYTKELDVSFGNAGKSTGSEGSCLEEQQSLHQVSEQGVNKEVSQAAHTTDLTVNPILDQLSVIEVKDSFRSLIGQVADRSSCLVAGQRDAAMEQLVGQPSAHSSMIGPLPGSPLSSGIGQSGRGSTSASHQSSEHWRRGEQDFFAGQLASQTEQSASSSSERPERSMRPLVGELDVSSGHHSGSSGERTRTDLGALTEATVPAYPSLPSEGYSHTASASYSNPLLQNQPSAIEDSFHPLPAELTHTGTTDPSVIFQVPDPDATDFSEGQLSSGELSVSAQSDLRSNTGASNSEQSTEHFRAEDDSCRNVTSLLVVSALLSDSSASDTPSALSILLEDDEQIDAAVSFHTPPTKEPKPEWSLNLGNISARLLEAANEKGILEQSQITLVSLTDSIVSEIEGLWEETFAEKGQKCQEESEAIIEEPSEAFVNQSPTHAGMLLEFNKDPDKDIQGFYEEKRKALLERSTRRAEELKAKAALAKTERHSQTALAKTERHSQTALARTERHSQTALARTERQSQTALELGAQSGEYSSCKAKTPQEIQHDSKLNTAKSNLSKQRKPQPCLVSRSTLNNPSDVKKGKRDHAEMRRRTERLYVQLDEVRQLKEIKSRREAYANNRDKAKAFHMETLKKLKRAKQTRH